MPSFEQDHYYLLELSNILEPKSQYSFDYTFSSIDNEITNYESWEEAINGPIPPKAIECSPQNWYTQYWFNCAINSLCANLDEYELREICDYAFGNYDETIYTVHFLDLY